MRRYLVDGHAVKRPDGSTLCVADTNDVAKQITAAIDACHEVLYMLRSCGYGGSNTHAEKKHEKLLGKITEALP